MDIKQLVIGAIVLIVPAFASATNGYFAHGTGIINRALGGAGVALPQDAMASGTNPAGMAFVGDRFDVGLVVFNPHREYSTSNSFANGMGGAFTIGPASQKSGDDIFFIPSFGFNKMITDRDAIGLSVYGNGGLNTTYRGSAGSATFDPDGPGPAPVTTFPGVFGTGATGADLSQLFFNISYAHKFSDHLSIGISPIFAVQSFRSNGLNAFAGFTKTFVESGFTQMPTDLTENGQNYSYGGGVQVGVLAKDLIGNADVGVSFRSKIWMDEFNDYSDLFAESGDFDIPPTLWVGFATELTDDLTFVFDFQRIWYDQVDAIGNDFERLFNCPALGGTNIEACLGGDDGAGFGWDNINVYKFGLQWQASANATWRFGYSHTDQPIDSDQILFNILATAVVEDHVTAGFAYKTQNMGTFNFEAMHAFHHSQDGINPLDPTQSIRVKMKQFEFGIGWSKEF